MKKKNLQQEPKKQKASKKEDLAAKMEELFDNVVTAAVKVQDYTCVFTKQEYINGKMQRMDLF